MSRRLPGSAIVPGSITLTQIAGSLNDTTNAAYAQANSARDQANTARSDANTTFATINTTFATLNTSAGTQNTNIGLAYDQANSARGQANTGYAQANSARDQANTARTTANDAYATANSRLPSVGGTVSGDLIITGNLTVSGNQTILNTEVLTTEDADIILLSNTAGTPALNAGLIVNRGTSTNTFIRWAENVDEWGWSDNGTVTYFFDDLRQGLITTNTTFGTINTNITNTNSNALNAYASANLAYTQANNARSDANTTFATVNTTFATINTTTATMNTATSNRVLKAGDTMTGVLNIANATALITTGNVGIGTTNPTSGQRLHVVGGSATIQDTNSIVLTPNYGGTTGIPAGVLINSGNAANVTFIADAASGTANRGVNISAFSGAAWFRGLSYMNKSGTPDLLLQQDGGNVGIGITNPATLMHVFNSSAAVDLIRLGNGTQSLNLGVNNTAGGSYLFEGTAAALRFGTNNLERMRIDSAGNVGVGITNPSSKFQVSNSGGTGSGFYVDAGNPNSTTTLFEHTGAATPVPFRLRKSGYSGAAGNYGILYLHMNDNTVGNGDALYFTLNDSAGNEHEYGGIGAVITANTNGAETGDLFFMTSDAGSTRSEKMRIKSGGNVGIGTTNPGARLEVSGTEIRVRSTNGARFQVFDDSSGNLGFRVRTATGGGWRWQFVDGGNGEYFGVDYTSGNTTIYGTLTELSSISLKENINPITNALETISMLVGVTYDRKDGTAIQRPGLIAEEVEKILPNVVIKDDAGTPSGISYTNLVAYLIESIKELKAEIDVLKSK